MAVLCVEIAGDSKVLVREVIPVPWSHVRAVAEDVSAGSSLWKRLHRIGLRHMRCAIRLLAREWQHLRGVK
jgi:hypothetical protein